MSIREKLVELIESARYWGSNTSEEIADRLIANGVTAQRWIPSSKRAPTEKDADRNGCVLARTLVNTNTTTDFKHVRNDREFYPYWMPLPEPPKGE